MIKVGDKVTRLLSSDKIPMELTVTAIDDSLIYCGPWTFDKTYGYEVDEDLGWGIPNPQLGGKIVTGSYLMMEEEEDGESN